jgi:predicted CoA-binding protein
MEQDKDIKDLLEKTRVIAIVGLSADEDKPSNGVARYLQRHGFRIVPVNPGQDTILGEKSYKSLADIPEPIDLVDIFMRSEKVLPVVEEAAKLKPKAIWLQLGIVNDDAKAAAEKSDIMFVQDKCVKIEHSRLF